METHPRYQHQSKDTGSLVRSLIVSAIAFAALTAALQTPGCDQELQPAISQP